MPGKIAVPWFSASEYPALAAAAPDMPASFAEFEALAGARFDVLLAQGAPLVKVLVSVDELLHWCAAQGMAPDGPGRSAFAAFVAMRRTGAH
jgi:hypothetical protein